MYLEIRALTDSQDTNRVLIIKSGTLEMCLSSFPQTSTFIRIPGCLVKMQVLVWKVWNKAKIPCFE